MVQTAVFVVVVVVVVVVLLVYRCGVNLVCITLKASARRCLKIRGFARQPCCMAGTMKMFCLRKSICSHRKKNLLFLPCNMAAVQDLYTIKIVQKNKYIFFLSFESI